MTVLLIPRAKSAGRSVLIKTGAVSKKVDGRRLG